MGKIEYTGSVGAGTVISNVEENGSEKPQKGFEVSAGGGIKVPLNEDGRLSLTVDGELHGGGSKSDVLKDYGIVPANGVPADSINNGNDPWGTPSQTEAGNPENPLPSELKQQYVGGTVSFGVRADLGNGFYLNPHVDARRDGFVGNSGDFLPPYADAQQLKGQTLGGFGLRAGYEGKRGIGGHIDAGAMKGARFYDEISGASADPRTHASLSMLRFGAGVSVNFSKLLRPGAMDEASTAEEADATAQIGNIPGLKEILDSTLNKEYKKEFEHDIITLKAVDDQMPEGSPIVFKVTENGKSEYVADLSGLLTDDEGKTFYKKDEKGDKINVQVEKLYIDLAESFDKTDPDQLAWLQDHLNSMLYVNSEDNPVNAATGQGIRKIILDKNGNLEDARLGSKRNNGRPIKLATEEGSLVTVGGNKDSSLMEIVSSYVMLDDVLHNAPLPGEEAQLYPSRDEFNQLRGLLGFEHVKIATTGEEGAKTRYIQADLLTEEIPQDILDQFTGGVSEIDIYALDPEDQNDPKENGGDYIIVPRGKTPDEVLSVTLPGSDGNTPANFANFESLLAFIRSMKGENQTYVVENGSIRTLRIESRTLDSVINFKIGKSDIGSVTNSKELTKLVDALKVDEKNIVGTVFVTGYASSIGWKDKSIDESHQLNRDLANARAKSIAVEIEEKIPSLKGSVTAHEWQGSEPVTDDYTGRFYTGDKLPKTEVSYDVMEKTSDTTETDPISITVPATQQGIKSIPANVLTQALGGKVAKIVDNGGARKMSLEQDGSINLGFSWKLGNGHQELPIKVKLEGSDEEIEVLLEDSDEGTYTPTKPQATATATATAGVNSPNANEKGDEEKEPDPPPTQN